MRCSQKKTNDGKYASYLLFEDAKTALKSIRNDPPMDFSKEEELPKEMYSTTVKVGGKEYYAETYTDGNGSEQTTCFGDNGMPKYQFFSERMAPLRLRCTKPSESVTLTTCVR